MKENKLVKLNNSNFTRNALTFGILFVLLIILFFWNMNSGSVSLSPVQVWKVLTGQCTDKTMVSIVWNIRLPRIIAAIFLGGALSVAGFLLQTFFNNPIAGPFILGISSGAKLMVSIAMVGTMMNGILLNSGVMIMAAFVGSLIAMGFVLLVSFRIKNMSVLIICGVMIGYICSAITDFIVTFADDSNIVNLHTWALGSFSGINWNNIKVIVLTIGIAIVISFLLSKPMGAYQMGEMYARSVGVPIKAFRIVLIVLSSILSACVTAFAGPISFVGVAVPHLVKSMLKTAKPILVIPACFLGGAVFCLFSDLIARTMFAPMEISISSVTAVLGAPVVIYLMIKRSR